MFRVKYILIIQFCLLSISLFGKNVVITSDYIPLIGNSSPITWVLNNYDIKPGDTIIIQSGVYNGGDIISGLHGEEGNPISIIADGDVIFNCGSESNFNERVFAGIGIINSSYLTIKGIKIHNAKNGVFIEGKAHNITLDGLEIKNCAKSTLGWHNYSSNPNRTVSQRASDQRQIGFGSGIVLLGRPVISLYTREVETDNGIRTVPDLYVIEEEKSIENCLIVNCVIENTRGNGLCIEGDVKNIIFNKNTIKNSGFKEHLKKDFNGNYKFYDLRCMRFYNEYNEETGKMEYKDKIWKSFEDLKNYELGENSNNESYIENLANELKEHKYWSGYIDGILINTFGHSVIAELDPENAMEFIPRSIYIVNNNVSGASREGIDTWVCKDILLKSNKFFNNGASGIQIEDGSFNVIVDGNECYNNSEVSGSEAGIWIDDTNGCLVKNNVVRNNLVGVMVTNSSNTIIRHNTIFENRKANIWHYYNSGIQVFEFGREIKNLSILHNSIFNNGYTNYPGSSIRSSGLNITPGSNFDNIYIINNIVSETTNGYELNIDNVGSTYNIKDRLIFSNNAYFSHSLNPEDPEDIISVLGKRRSYNWYKNINFEEGFLYETSEAVGFTNDDPMGFSLEEDSPCKTKGKFLTKTMNNGYGNILTVENSLFFNDGFGFYAGDIIAVSSLNNGSIEKYNEVRILDVDYDENKITIDRNLNWDQGDNISFPFSGLPDIGAGRF